MSLACPSHTQLALCVTRLETGKTEAEVLRTRGSVEEGRLHVVVREREAQLVRLVKELYELATAERVPGVVAHDARARVFRRCAVVYEQLGEAAFAATAEGEGEEERAGGLPTVAELATQIAEGLEP